MEKELKGKDCAECGQMFFTDWHLQQHVRKCCPADTDDDDSNDGPARKKAKLTDEEEQAVFYPFIQESWKKYMKPGVRLMVAYEDEGYSKQAAKNKSKNDLLARVRKEFRRQYLGFLNQWQGVLDSTIHQKVVESARKLEEEEGLDCREAMEQSVQTKKHMFNKMIPELDVDEETDTDEEDTGEESDNVEDETEEHAQS
jgi:hypothetical protein